MFFEALKVARDTWHGLSGSHSCQVENNSNTSLSGAMWDMCQHMIGGKSKVMNKWIRGNPREPMRS